MKHAVTALLAVLTGLMLAWWFIDIWRQRSTDLPNFSECFPFKDVAPKTSCPVDDDWIWRFRLATAHVDRDTVFLDVGCNTGVDAAKWLDIWGATPGVHSAWGSYLRSHGAGSGACRQNEEGSEGPASGQRQKTLRQKTLANPTVICVEPMPANVEILRAARRDVLHDNEAFLVVAAAVSDKPGIAPFPAGHIGAEVFNMNSPQEGIESVQVNVTTVDLLVEQYGHQRVDVLTIDTEGWDPRALEGASNVLRTVRYLTFEVHQDFPGTPWPNASLFNIVQKLDALHLDCFWEGRGKVQRITSCWTAEDEQREYPLPWSNVACVRRGDPWHEILQQFVGRIA